MVTPGAPEPLDQASLDVPERVAVVVVMYNSEHLLPGFFASLEQGLSGVEFELVAVDNASADSSAALTERIAPDAKVVRLGRNAGYAAGINAGVAAAGSHTAVLVVNSDVRLGPGCVQELLRALRAPDVGIVVPRLTDAKGNLIDSMRREPTIARAFGDAIFGARRAGRLARFGEVVTDPRAYDVRQRTDWAEGSTQLISSDCWRACGEWDESFFLYCEETEYNLRARDRGYATEFVPSACATHLEGGSGISHGLWTMQVLNRIRLFRRRHGALSTSFYWAATVLREATRGALGRSNSRVATRALLNRRHLRTLPTADSVDSGPER